MTDLTKTKQTHFQIKWLFYMGWFAFLIATLLPVREIIHWYEVLQQTQVTPITGPINSGASEILSFIRENPSSFLLQIMAIASRSLLKWLMVIVAFFLLSSRFHLFKLFYSCCEGLVDKIKNAPRRNLLIVAFLTSLVITCLLSYQTHWFFPDYPDNVAQLYQAKLFKQGKIFIAPPKHGMRFFWYPNIIHQPDRWYSNYTPGNPFLLMLGLFLGMPWLVNPILGSLSIILLYKLGLEVYGEDTARIGLCLMLLSPFFLTISSGFLNNASTMFFSLLGIYCFIKTLNHASLLYPLLSGLSLGYAANIRPMTGFLVALPLAIYFIYLFFKQPKNLAVKFIFIGLGLAFSISILLCYNYLANGHPLVFGIKVKHANSSIWFGKVIYGINHTPFRAIVRFCEKLNQLNFSLFGWPIPSLAFIFLFLLQYFKKNRWDYLFMAIIMSMLAGYGVIFYLKVRYFYALVPLLVLLTARGIMGLFKLLKESGFDERRIKSAVYALMPIFIGYMVYTSILPQLSPSGKYKHLVYRLVKQKDIHNAIVFMPAGFSGWGIYGQGFVHNDPEFKGDVIYAVNRGDENIKLMRQYPQRSYFFFDRKPDGSYQFAEIKSNPKFTATLPVK